MSRKFTVWWWISKTISKRVSSLSASQPSFEAATPIYREALKNSNYNDPFTYQPGNKLNKTGTPPSRSNSTRQRNIIWFNPPFSKSVKTNVGKTFQNLIEKHFPPSNPIHKVFNRNNVKVSYSCMESIKSTISSHNHKLSNPPAASDQCNCQNVNQCPLNGKCLAKSIVYKAEIRSQHDGAVKTYIGMTSYL